MARESSRTELHRRLAAIMVADVVGYSALMAKDEEGTFALIRRMLREEIGPVIEQYSGRIVKTAGDGLVAEFPSAVDAVRSAVDIQGAISRATEGRDAGSVLLRIGLNFGDIIVDPDGDVFGDGVNVAARLEQLASPGGICLSGKVHDEVRDRLTFPFDYWGEHQLKNIPRPVPVYALLQDKNRAAIEAAAYPRGTNKPSVLVRPFAGVGGVEAYFVDGFTEDIVTELTRFTQLSVASHHASLQLKERSLEALAGDHSVQFLVDGNMRRVGLRLRISCQLVDANSGDCLWAERFDRNEQDIFDVQDELVSTIVGTLIGRLKAAGAEKARRKPPTNLAAYECVLRGNALPMGDIAAEAEARIWYERATQLDPTYGRAFAKLAHYIQLEWFRDMGPSDAKLDEAHGIAKKAVALAPNDPVCLNILGWILLHQRDFAVAAELYARTLELNPNDPEQISYLGTFHLFNGEPERALQFFERARALDPLYEPSWYWPFRGLAHFIARRFEPAIVALNRSPTMPVWVLAYLAAAHELLGMEDGAAALRARVIRALPDFSATRFAGKEPYRLESDRATLLDGLQSFKARRLL